jgi:FxsC-like protein
MPPVFFFSYAHANKIQDKKLETFFDDLSTEVAQLLGAGQGKPGFLDQENLQLGVQWSPTLADALQTTKVLISLISADYLASSFCGKEFQVFLNRREQHGANPVVILPIIWTKTPTRPLPGVVTQIQYADARLPNTYTDKGLRSMMMSSDTANYRKFIEALTDTIISAAALNPPLPPLHAPPDFDAVNNPFAMESAPIHPPLPGNASSISTTRIVYVAAPNNEIAAAELRTVTTHYGRSGYFWQPYHPSLSRPVGEITFDSVRGYEYKSADFGPNIVDELIRAEAAGEVIVLIVDPWTIRLAPYQKLMRQFDERALIKTGVVIPWNAHDDESSQSEAKLSAAVRVTFQKLYENTNRFRFPVKTADDFSNAIKHILTHVSLNASELQAAQIALQGPALATVSAAAAGAGTR